MKKLLGSTLAMVLLVPTMANAELLKNLKIDGQLDVADTSANNVTDLSTSKYDNINTIQTRLMLGADWDVLDDVHSHVNLLKNNRAYGTGAESLSTVENNIIVAEANVKIDKLFGAIDATVGRQFYGEPGDMVIYFGPRNDFGLSVTAIDAGTFVWSGDKVGVKVLAGKTSGTALALTGNSDSANTTVWGFDVNAKPSDNASGNVYLYDRETVNSGQGGVGVVGNDYLYVAGLKGKVTAGGAWLKAEIAKDFGENRTAVGVTPVIKANYTGMAGKISLGDKVDINGVGAVTGWGEAGMGSGGASNRTFQAIAGDYRPGGIAGRFWSGADSPMISGMGFPAGTSIDQGSLGNRVDLGAGVKYNPAQLSKLTVGVSIWDYHFQSANQAPNGKKNLGYEVDLDATWKHSENVAINAGVGSFQPGGLLDQAATTGINPATLGYVDLSVKF